MRDRENDPEAAGACFTEALALARELGESERMGLAFSSISRAWHAIGVIWRGPVSCPRRRSQWPARLRNPWSVAMSLLELTEIALTSGAWDEARCNLMEMLPIVRDLGLRSVAEPVLRQSSELAAAVDEAAQAARWSAAATALQSAMGSKRQPERDRANHAAIMARVRETLGAAGVRAGYRRRPRARLRGGTGGGTSLAGGSRAMGPPHLNSCDASSLNELR